MAQECINGRYSLPIFSAIDTHLGVEYGSNIGVDGSPQTLYMDIYAPADDDLSTRPVVVAAFGGSFVTGSRADMAEFCTMLAHMGYVAVAPDYRVGFFYPTTTSTMRAVQRCVHDLRGAIRFLRQTEAEGGNPYGIDPDRIVVGGVSAGAIGAIHATYMNEPEELPSVLVADSAQVGGMEGTSGPLGFSSAAMACFSLSGAILDTTMIDPGDQPFLGIHETGDEIVPCYTEEVNALGIPTGIIVSGDHDISLRMDHIGLPHCYLEYPGTDHVGYLVYDADNALAYLTDFLTNVVCDEALTCFSGPAGLTNPQAKEAPPLKVYPSPASAVVTIELDRATPLVVLDAGGRIVLREAGLPGPHRMDVSALEAGVYVVRTLGTPSATARLVVLR